jgi:hypothetical protein
MKRTFDTAMGSSAAQQISAGMTATKDPVYYSTNMVNISNEDTTTDHGISATFSQTRILPIVGKTSRAEIAIESADIQTKALPIFQPQVKLGNDIDDLIYEVGISAQWRGSMLALPPDSSYIDPLLVDSGIELASDTTPPFNTVTVLDPIVNTGTQLQTFTNNPNALGTLMDAYGLSKPVSLIPQNLYSWDTPTTQALIYPYTGNSYTWTDTSSPPWKNIAWVYNDSRDLILYFSNTTSAVCYIHNTNSVGTVSLRAYGTQQQVFLAPGDFKTVTASSGGVTLSAIPAGWYSGASAVNTTLNSLFDYWNGAFKGLNPDSSLLTNSEIAGTCLTPVCVGSVTQKISGCGMFESNIEYPTSLVVPIASTDGFAVGDRVRFFGMTDVANPLVVVPTVYGTVLDVISYNLLQNPSNQLSPALIVDYYPSFTIQSATVGALGSSRITLTLKSTFALNSSSLYNNQSIVISGTNTTPSLNGTYSLLNVDTSTTAGPGTVNIIILNSAFAQVAPGPLTGGTGTLLVNTLFSGGYVINPKVKDGGHIEFLTNEQAFQPRVMQYNQDIVLNSNELVLTTTFTPGLGTNPGDVMNTGWFKGMNVGTALTTTSYVEDFPITNTVVKLTLRIGGAYTDTGPFASSQLTAAATIAAEVNGYYRISRRISTVNNAESINFYLTPLNASISISGDSAFSSLGNRIFAPITFLMELAPNFYTFDTRADIVIDDRLDNSVNELTFLRSLGYKPTTDLSVNTPTRMPTLLLPSTTWDRAYMVDWSFSSYQNIKWKTQNSTSRLPNLPLSKQDFGVDSNSTTYYNVYEINKFLNGCVNPSIKNLLTDYSDATSPNIFEIKSLNTQLALAFDSYASALTVLTPTSTQYIWSPSLEYSYATVVVDTLAEGGSVFLSLQYIPPSSSEPSIGSSSAWMYLGPVPVFPSTQQLGALAFTNQPTLPNPLSVFTETNVLAYSFFNFASQVLKFTGPTLSTTLFRPTPSFKTAAPIFSYDEHTLLLSWTLDNYGFSANQTSYDGETSANVANLSYERLSWGNKNADEFMSFESNSPFKFLFDNFPCECISYQDTLASLRRLTPGQANNSRAFPLINYWIWDSTSTKTLTDRYFTLFQSCESFSSCMTPVESIVIVSENIPVAEQLTSPPFYLFDSSTTQTRPTDATALTNKIIGEIFLPYVPFQSARTVVKYEPFEMKFYSLLDTKSFKQLDYSLFYRHRITQELIPLIITNYGSVNIKFVFRPTST